MKEQTTPQLLLCWSLCKILDFSRIGDISNDAYVTSIANFNEIQDLPGSTAVRKVMIWLFLPMIGTRDTFI
jgi:hypothetical protein